jgi:hypothetical protein
MNGRDIVDNWHIPGVQPKDRWIGVPSAGQSLAASLLARGAVNYYVFGALTEVWINVNLEPGTVELQDVVNRLPSGPLATLDHLPADFEDVVAWARMVKELSKGE